MEARPVPPSAPRPPQQPWVERNGRGRDELLACTALTGGAGWHTSPGDVLAADSAVASSAAASVPSVVGSSNVASQNDSDTAATDVAMAHIQKTDRLTQLLIRQPCAEPVSAPNSSGHNLDIVGRRSICDERMSQIVAQRCISVRKELSGLGTPQLRARACKEGLAKTEIEGSVEALRERLTMHIAYQPVHRRGKMAKEGSGDGLLKSANRCQRRLFVLDAKELCYYDSNKKGPPEYRPSKTIALDEVEMVAEAPDRAEIHDREHCFSVTTPSRTFCESHSTLPREVSVVQIISGLDLLSEAPGAVGREISKQWMNDIELNVWLRQRRKGGGQRWVADNAR